MGERAHVLVVSLVDHPEFVPMRKRSDPTWVPFGNWVCVRVTSSSRSLLSHGHAVIALAVKPPACTVGTGTSPHSVTTHDSE